MLINGDLVRIPQGTVIIDSAIQFKDSVPLSVAKKPQVGIVIETKNDDEDLVKVLFEDQMFFVDKRVVQLVGG
jgi:hypothetical protein|tara:strand:+ start:1070 stop:1288 length:219 start_codon:yes stop_codon:yes gene_type:complete